MLESISELVHKYLDANMVAEMDQAGAAGLGCCFGVYDYDRQSFYLPTTGGVANRFPQNLNDPEWRNAVTDAQKQPASGARLVHTDATWALAPIAVEEGCVGYLLAAPVSGSAEAPREEGLKAACNVHARLFAEALNGRRASLDLTRELLDRFEEIALVYAMGEAMAVTADTEHALETVLDRAVEALKADLVYIEIPALRLRKILPPGSMDEALLRRLVPILQARIGADAPLVAVNFIENDPELCVFSSALQHVAAVRLSVDNDPGVILLLRRSPDQQLYMNHVKLLEVTARQIGIFLSNHKITRARQQLFDATIFGLARLAEDRDPETGTHLERVSAYCHMISRYLLEQNRAPEEITPLFVENMYRSSPLHDIGKVGIPDAVLLKPGKLTEIEFEFMKMHAVIGGKAIKDIERRLDWEGSTFLTLGREIAFCHHERWDGSGYPQGLAGDAIPLPGRIMAIADVYDALTTKRCYKPAFSHEESRQIILEGNGTHFDPAIVDAFVALEEHFQRVMFEKREA